MYLKIIKNYFNVFHYYVKKKEKICKMKHVQGITLTHLELKL